MVRQRASIVIRMLPQPLRVHRTGWTATAEVGSKETGCSASATMGASAVVKMSWQYVIICEPAMGMVVAAVMGTVGTAATHSQELIVESASLEYLEDHARRNASQKRATSWEGVRRKDRVNVMRGPLESTASYAICSGTAGTAANSATRLPAITMAIAAQTELVVA